MVVRFHELVICDVVRETSNSVAVAFDLPEALESVFRFRPGQYLTLRAEIGGNDLRRTYSIASCPGDPLLVGIKRQPQGRFSGFAQNLQPGDVLRVMPPRGRFVFRGQSNILLLAAGSGITPIISIACHALAAGSRVTLLYGNRSKSSVMFLSRLIALKDTHLERFSVLHCFSQDSGPLGFHGRVTGDWIKRLARAGHFESEAIDGIFICGPGQMIATLTEELKGFGFDGDRIHSESFLAPEPSGQSKAHAQNVPVDRLRHNVELRLDGVSYRLTLRESDRSIIDAAARRGIDLPYSCRGGMCCTCRCRILSGSAEMAVNYSLEDWEIQSGYTLACQARPTSRKLVLDFDAI